MIIIGFTAGALATFFGIGGGLIIIATLTALGFSIKEAIVLSVMQIFFISWFSNIVEFKKNQAFFKNYYILGIGGILGAFIGTKIMLIVNEAFLQYLFLSILLLSLLQFTLSKNYQVNDESTVILKKKSSLLIGFIIGIFSGLIGIGGGILLIPLLSFLKVNLKQITKIGIIYISFSSTSAFISYTYFGVIPYEKAMALIIPALIGTYLGKYALNKINNKYYKLAVITLYVVLTIITIWDLIAL